MANCFEHLEATKLSTDAIPWTKFRNPEPYIHQPLDISKQEIRLLRLQRDGDGFSCSLRHYYLASAPPFQALSYTWGCAQKMQAIPVDRKAFYIRSNLYEFLETWKVICSRAKSRSTYIWIDQISINQTESSERNHQVQLMGAIYSQAIQVITWLIPSSELPEKFYHYFDCPYVRDKPNGSGCDYGCTWLDTFLKNGYWRRLWIIQEVLLATRNLVYYKSNDEIWSFTLQQLVHLMANHPSTFDARTAMQLPWLLRSKEAMNNMSGYEKIDFADALRYCWASQCSEPRDKIYALQGLIRDEQRIEVDYDNSIANIFIEAVLVLLRDDSHGFSNKAESHMDIICLLGSVMGLNMGGSIAVTLIREAITNHAYDIEALRRELRRIVI